MTKGVHRMATELEKSLIPDAFTFNRLSEQFHNRDGFPILVSVDLIQQLLAKAGRKRKR
jgi:hypothetical protein